MRLFPAIVYLFTVLSSSTVWQCICFGSSLLLAQCDTFLWFYSLSYISHTPEQRKSPDCTWHLLRAKLNHDISNKEGIFTHVMIVIVSFGYIMVLQMLRLCMTHCTGSSLKGNC